MELKNHVLTKARDRGNRFSGLFSQSDMGSFSLHLPLKCVCIVSKLFVGSI